MSDRLEVEKGRSDAIARDLTSKPGIAERFEILGPLGKGGAGAVFRVRDSRRGGEEVALKILADAAAFDEHTLERFREEIQVCQRIHHPHLVQAYDLIETDGVVGYTMELVEGADLGKLIGRREFSTSELEKMFAQILSALEALHAHRIFHRDLKLDNVLLRDDGTIKLFDLGLMKQHDHNKTRTGVLLGTAQYLPPEYVRQSVFDARGDIYATGLMLYELLTKKRWISDKAGVQAIEYLIKTKFQIPPLPGSVPAKFRRIVERAVQVNPGRRFQTAQEMRRTFERSDLMLTRPMVLASKLLMWQNSAGKNRARRFVSFGATVLVFGLIVALCVPFRPAGILTPSAATKVGTGISEGEYQGSLELDTTTRIKASVKSNGMFLSAPLRGCQIAYIDLKTGAVSCGKSGYSVRIDSVTADSFGGRILTSEPRREMAFRLRKITSP